MKTKFKTSCSKLLKKMLAIPVLMFVVFLSTAQETDNRNIDLKLVNIEFPDSIEIGETIILSAYLKNEGFKTIAKDISIYFDIESFEPSTCINECFETEEVQNITLHPGDSTLLQKQFQISTSKFNSNTTNVIIIWPEVASLRQPIRPYTYVTVKTYVMDNNTIDSGFEDEINDNDNWSNSEQGYKIASNKYDSANLLQNFKFFKNNQKIIIEKISDEVDFMGANIYSIVGRKLGVIDASTHFPAEILYSIEQPILINLKIRHKSHPENIYATVKLF